MTDKRGGQSFLAIDLGASSGRAVLGFLRGERLKIEEVHRFMNLPVEVRGTIYWDVLMLFREIQEGVRKAFDRTGSGLAGIGVDTWGVDFGLLDEAGRLVANPVHYRDQRADGVMEEVFRIVARHEIFKTTGIQFMQLNTLFQLAAMRFQGWAELESGATLLMMPDLFNYFLCGEKVSEFTNATTTQFYDPVKGGWAIDLLRALDIPVNILPEIVAPGTVLGPLVDDPEDREVPVIAPATHDTGAAVAAVPAKPGARPGAWAYISSGTWSLMGIEVKKPLINDTALSHNFTNEGGVGGTFRFLKNIAGLWLIQECRRAWSMEDGREYSFQELDQWAREAKPFSAFIDPDHHSFLRPDKMPAAIARFCRDTGQAAPATRGETIRAILESLALKYRIVRDAIEDVSGTGIEVMHVVGGGCQNELLNRFTADALGIPVLAGPVEATSIGNLMVQAIAAKAVPDLAAARAVIRDSFPMKTFEPRETGRWSEAMDRFEKIVARAR